MSDRSGNAPLGFALVGCGRIAQRHAELLGRGLIPGARLVGVCDIAVQKAEALGKAYGVPHFDDMHRMMETLGTTVDVVNILTESGNHARHCIALAPYGLPIIVEKPMALRLDDAEAMITACDRAGIPLYVVKQNRLNLPVRRLRQALEQGRFGKLVMGSVRVRWCRTQDYYDQAGWRGTWAMDGGVFANQASHHIDLLTWMLGEPESVFAYTTRALANIEAEDTGVAMIRFANGALGVVEATTATRPRDLEGSLSLLGEKGTVEIGGFAVNKLLTWQFAEALPDEDLTLDAFSENPPDVYGYGHRAYLTQVVENICGGKSALVDGLEGLKSLRLITAIYESAATGKEVRLKYRPQTCPLGWPP